MNKIYNEGKNTAPKINTVSDNLYPNLNKIETGSGAITINRQLDPLKYINYKVVYIVIVKNIQMVILKVKISYLIEG